MTTRTTPHAVPPPRRTLAPTPHAVAPPRRTPTPRTAAPRRRTPPVRAIVALAAALVAVACHTAPEAPAVHARFGVFFGGQVQERDEIPLVLDRARQNIGIRLEFAHPSATPERVTWELEKPRAAKTGASLGSVVDYGEARTRPGEPVLDVPLAFREGDRPGAWRVRVALDGKSLLDRGFKVIPASEAPSDN